jgi:hypothetical protein
MWDEYQGLTPEERLDRIVDILAEGVLRIIEEKKKKDTLCHPSPSDKSRHKQLKTEQKILSQSP